MKESVNKGREFYVCPRPQNDPGRCNFFMWATGPGENNAQNQNFGRPNNAAGDRPSGSNYQQNNRPSGSNYQQNNWPSGSNYQRNNGPGGSNFQRKTEFKGRKQSKYANCFVNIKSR